ncbi:hypothetical protein [Bacteroides uniformis]|uniref:hypothetical protein n=1 Tax=Bacteroides uniformis TaxID=820 RepID=UPI0011C345B0|nr:hypothetical protein [Bacteroides uniformis]MDC1829680.1 hypothetical protein [Bacteroides uniformis]
MNGTGRNATLSKSGNCSSGNLYIVRTTDEDRNVSCLFTDKLGRMVLQRRVIGSDNHDTYYVYDNRDNLRFVLPSRLRDEGISQERMHWPIAISTTAATAACGGSCPAVMPCAMSTTRPTV